MSVYLSLLVLGLMMLLVTRVNPRAEYVAAGVYVFALTVVAMFRYDVGQDYFAYEIIFDKISTGFDNDKTEAGFRAICWIVNAIGGTPQMMFAICALITMTFLYKSFRYFSTDLVMSLFIFMCVGQMYLNTFNAMRQSMATAVIFYAFIYIVRKRMWVYMALIVLASSFHMTALLFIPLYWVLNRGWKKIPMLIICGVAVMSSGFLIELILSSGYASYALGYQYIAQATFINALYLALSVLIFLFSKRMAPQWRYRTIFLNLNTIAMMCFAMNFVFTGSPVMTVIMRISYYFMFGYALLWPAIIRGLDGNLLKSNVTLALIGMLGFLFVRSSIVMGKEYNLMPFTFNFLLIA